MHHGYLIPEPPVEPEYRLEGQRNLRDQHNSFPALLQHRRDQLHIDLCLAASGDAVNQGGTQIPLRRPPEHVVYNPLLGRVQGNGMGRHLRGADRIPENGIRFHTDQPQLLKLSGRGCRQA